MEKAPFTSEVVTETLMTDYNRDSKLSLKGKFGAELSKEILDVDLEASDNVTLDIKFGKVVKLEVKEPELLEELSKRYEQYRDFPRPGLGPNVGPFPTHK